MFVRNGNTEKHVPGHAMRAAWAMALILALTCVPAIQGTSSLPLCSLDADGITTSEFKFDGTPEVSLVQLGGDGSVRKTRCQVT